MPHEGGLGRLLDKVAKHGGGDVEIGDDAVLQRADGSDGSRGAADHFLGFGAHGHHNVLLHIGGHHRGLPDGDALALDIDQGVGRPQIDADVMVEKHNELSFFFIAPVLRRISVSE